MAIPNPAKARELLDGKKLRDKERDELRVKREREFATEKRQQVKLAKLKLDEAFKAALEGSKFVEIADNLGNDAIDFLTNHGFRIATIDSILTKAVEDKELDSSKRSTELAYDLATYNNLKNALIHSVCSWVNVRFPGRSKEVSEYLDKLLDLGANFTKLNQVTAFLDSWVIDSYEGMEIATLIHSDDAKRPFLPDLELNFARVEKLKLLSKSCLTEAMLINDKISGYIPSNSKLLSDLENFHFSLSQKILIWDSCGTPQASFESVNASMLQWLSSNEGQDLMTEVDYSVKGSARAGLGCVNIDCSMVSGRAKISGIAEIFKKLGFKTQIVGSTLGLSWE